LSQGILGLIQSAVVNSKWASKNEKIDVSILKVKDSNWSKLLKI